MRQQVYVSMKARMIASLLFLVFMCLALLAGISFALSRTVLLDMQKNNLDLTTRIKQTQTSETLEAMLVQVVHMTTAQPLQQILQHLDDRDIIGEQSLLLAESLDTTAMVEATLYSPNVTELVQIVLPDGANSTIPPKLFPLSGNESTSKQQYVRMNGIYVSGPDTQLNTTNRFLISFTVPVLLSEPWDNFQSDTDLANRTDVPLLGYLTSTFACDKIQSFLADASSTAASSGVSAAAIGRLEAYPSYRMLVTSSAGTPYPAGWLIDMPGNFWTTLNNKGTPTAEEESGSRGIISASTLPFRNQQYIIVVYQAHDGVFAMVDSLSHTLAISACLVLIGATLLTVFITYSANKPLKKLQDATKNRNKLRPQKYDNEKAILEPTSIDSHNDSTDDALASGISSHNDSSDTEHALKVISNDHRLFTRKPRHGTTYRLRSTFVAPSPPDSLATAYEKPASTTLQGNWFRHLMRIRRAQPVLGSSGEGSSTSESGEDKYSSTEAQTTDDTATDVESEFEVPPKVALKRKHLRDEFDDITLRFNGMSEALKAQYRLLEDRVETRKREIEEARRMADEANASKSHFLARVTHELRTPLNGILGTATLCMDEESVPEIRTSLKTIFKCGELLLHLLTDLLSFSQNEVDKLDLDENEFMISEVTSQLKAIFREQSEGAGVQLKIEADQNCQNLIMFGDINRILQVVFNLLSNSLKFTPEGGTVSFKVTADPLPDPNVRQVTFVVNDTGPGIASHLQSRIFEAFVQGDINTKVRKAGVGLGLSICRQLADRMGGSIVLNSELGKGSEFVFTVPLKFVSSNRREAHAADSNKDEFWPEYELYSADTIRRRAETELESGRKHGPSNTAGNVSPHSTTPDDLTSPQCRTPGQNPSDYTKVWGLEQRPEMRRGTSCGPTPLPDMRVLVTDDNKVNQEVMVRMLNLEGIKDISVANDGLEAIEKVKESLEEERPYDIIFMDVQMPNLDGRKASQILRKDYELQVPIVAVSAFANDDNVQECLEAGMTVFLAKPLRRPSLRKLLQSLDI